MCSMSRFHTWSFAIVAGVIILECGGFSQGHQCWPEVPVNDTDCKAFRNFCYIFDMYPHNRTVVLVLDMRRHVPDLLVRMRSADCDFRCREASAASCNVTEQALSEPTRTGYHEKNFVQQYYAFQIITGNRFCATVSLSRCNKFFNVIHTITDKFGEDGDSPPVPVPDRRQPIALIVLCTSLAITTILVMAGYCIKTRLLCSLSLGGTVPLELKSSDTSCLLPQAAPPTSAILLLYSRDSDAFVRLMEAFRELLTALTGLEVLDPLDSRRLEEVFPAPVGWLWRQLRRQDVRVVVVVSAGALARQRRLLGQRTQDPAAAAAAAPHPLDYLFTLALRDMQDDYRLGGDYRRVYKVRFEDVTTTTETLSHIVPMREFCLMRHIGRLVHEIRGEIYPPDADDVTHSQELLTNVPEVDSLFVILQEITG
ncbi:uncharacterized protein LOC126416650 isoform X1 [Schistocerca serialis cubense]|uniref:uncharacterized protein LOC126416650 isoform X1 n=1 Tax=Schistocerca serialis cubense TaxID=2023355 RepID=UPI00214ECF59|nr:uncharacterized protein LOC126416650 isoform X1 [Schistocerca serialis cubense]